MTPIRGIIRYQMEEEAAMYDYLKENPNDKNYPYIIRDGWDGECHMTKEGLEKLLKEIKKALDKPNQK